MGQLGWPPRDFWSATVAEVHEAVDGKNGDTGPRVWKNLTEDDVDRLLELI